MVIKIKNNTGSLVDISDIGISIPASSEYTVEAYDYQLIQASSDLITLINDDTVSILSETYELTNSESVTFVKSLNNALTTIFFNNDYRNNGILETTVQEVIENLIIQVTDSLIDYILDDDKIITSGFSKIYPDTLDLNGNCLEVEEDGILEVT